MITEIECECGKKLSIEEILLNERIAKDAKILPVNLCENCWYDYCNHAITGE